MQMGSLRLGGCQLLRFSLPLGGASEHCHGDVVTSEEAREVMTSKRGSTARQGWARFWSAQSTPKGAVWQQAGSGEGMRKDGGLKISPFQVGSEAAPCHHCATGPARLSEVSCCPAA